MARGVAEVIDVRLAINIGPLAAPILQAYPARIHPDPRVAVTRLKTRAEVVENFHHARGGFDNEPSAPVGSAIVGLVGVDLAVQDQIAGLGEASPRQNRRAEQDAK